MLSIPYYSKVSTHKILFALECLLYGPDSKKWLFLFFPLKIYIYILLLGLFIFVRIVVFGSAREVFLDNSIFSLTACHCLSAHGNKSFSICHSYLSPHLLLILHCLFPPWFSSSTHFFLLFWLFSPDISAVLDFLKGCIFFTLLQPLGVFSFFF